MFFVVGIIISFFLDVLLISKKHKTTADKILAVWLFFLGIHLLLFYLIYISGQPFKYPWWLGWEIPLPLIHGPFLYLYTAALTQQLPRQRKYIALHFVPVLFCGVCFSDFYTQSVAQKMFVYQHKGVGYEAQVLINGVVIVLSGLAYVTWSAWLLRKYNRSFFEQFSYTEKINLKWLQYLIYGIAGIWIFVILDKPSLIFSAVVMFVLFIGYFGIKQVGIFTYTGVYGETGNKTMPLPVSDGPMPAIVTNGGLPAAVAGIPADKRKYAKSGLTDTTALQLHAALTRIMDEEQLFTESELSLSGLASRLNTHPNYLSQIINELEGKSFYEYINTLRIEAFKKLIAHPGNHQYTILTLAYECGFNSKSSFNRYFKKVMGQSPSAYLRSLNITTMPDNE
jgi:AraC-like DNA-binding protein